jgi:hypothetical protein
MLALAIATMSGIAVNACLGIAVLVHFTTGE